VALPRVRPQLAIELQGSARERFQDGRRAIELYAMLAERVQFLFGPPPDSRMIEESMASGVCYEIGVMRQ
jgi:hypothetical protein